MKQIITLIFLLLSIHSFSQKEIIESDKIATFCKVWGFLKYHHPAVAKGKYDWDNEFLQKIKILQQLKNKGEINAFYCKWILSLGKLRNDKRKNLPPNVILSNYDFTWLKDTSTFTNQVTELLLLTQNNSRVKNHYVKRRFFGLSSASYVNEKPYPDSVFLSSEMRLLLLARYWNIVNYFYPYKHLTETNWQDVITGFVPRFMSAKTNKEYHLDLLELFAKLNDSHTGFNSQLYESSYKLPPFNNKIIDDKIIVTNAFNDSVCKSHDIRYGDVISKVNVKSIKSIIDDYSKYISASNYASLCKQLTPQVVWADLPDSVVITCERNGQSFDKTLPHYSLNLLIKDFQTSRKQTLPKPVTCGYKIFENNIAYVNLAEIESKKESKKVLKSIRNTDAIILDIRNYPNSSIFHPITNFFCTSKQPFAKFAVQSIEYPGVLTWAKTVYCGRNNGKKYKGRVAVLVDATTISFAEYFTMALKTIPNAILIGSHTAGADGSNNRLILPGNITTSFSNEAVYFPNGSETQRKGIIPDIVVLPTIEGIRQRKDEVLEKALEATSKKQHN